MMTTPIPSATHFEMAFRKEERKNGPTIFVFGSSFAIWAAQLLARPGGIARFGGLPFGGLAV